MEISYEICEKFGKNPSKFTCNKTLKILFINKNKTLFHFYNLKSIKCRCKYIVIKNDF